MSGRSAKRIGAPKDWHWIYLIRVGKTAFWKIGITGNFLFRIQGLDQASPIDISTILLYRVSLRDKAKEHEEIWLNEFSQYNHKGEWLKLRPPETKKVTDAFLDMAAIRGL